MQSLTVLVYDAEEGGYWAEVPELPGCVSQGESLDELERNSLEAAEAWIASRVEDGSWHVPPKLRRWDIPMPEVQGA